MVISFDRPLGAPADVAELEYVSALHQTAPQARTDGSLDAADIRYYLRSRFGVQVTLDTVRETILQGLGGSDETGEVIDLMELVAILVIPYLVKADKISRGERLPDDMIQPKTHVMKHVCEMIVHDVLADHHQEQKQERQHPHHRKSENDNEEETRAPRLEPDLIRRILYAYGEADLAADDALIQGMMQQVAGHERLDAAALLTGCTADVRLYDPTAEVRYTTTYEAVMGDYGDSVVEEINPNVNNSLVEKSIKEEEYDDEEEEEEEEKREDTENAAETVATRKEQEALPKAPELKHIFSAPAIDSTADTFWSKSTWKNHS